MCCWVDFISFWLIPFIFCCVLTYLPLPMLMTELEILLSPTFLNTCWAARGGQSSKSILDYPLCSMDTVFVFLGIWAVAAVYPIAFAVNLAAFRLSSCC